MRLATRSKLPPSISTTSLSQLTLKKCFDSKSYFRANTRFYHSYPDPNEKPNITYAKANAEKIFDKKDKKFQLDDRFKMDNLFPGTPISKGISKENAPQTIVSTLDNGLTVASQEMPGLMSSFSFLVKAGRYIKMLNIVEMLVESHIACALVHLKFRVEIILTLDPSSFWN